MRASTSTLRNVARSTVASSVLATVLFALGGCSADVAGASESVSSQEEESLGTNESALSLPALGSGSVFAPIPTPPGWPEGIVVVGDRVYVSAPATFGTAGRGPSQVLVFDLQTGAPKAPITIQGEFTQFEHALGCITSDGDGRLYVLSTQLGVVRLTRSGGGWVQDIYAPALPDLPPCPPQPSGPCSPTTFDGPPLVNDLAFDRAGNLYITDSFQATVFKVAPGGGAPTIWFQSPALEGIPFNIGVNGLRITPDQKSVYVTVTLPAQNPAFGRLYSIPRVAAPAAQDLELVHEFGPGDAPDGIAFGITGKLYVALAGTNAISVLAPNGTETRRFTGPTGSAIPYDGPANIAFDRRGSILVTNHAPVTNNPASFAVLEQFVADLAFPLAKPDLP